MLAHPEIDATGLLAHTSTLFRLGPDSYHGQSHWQAVMCNAVELSEALEGDTAVAVAFALLHDCRRENEWRDPQHGPRAADVAREINGRFFDFAPVRLATLCEAIRWHDAGWVSDDLTTSCCWSADRIELRRVGIEPARWGFCGATWPVAQRILSRGGAVQGAGGTW